MARFTGDKVYQHIKELYEADKTDDKSQYKTAFNQWVQSLRQEHGDDEVVFDFSHYEFKPGKWIVYKDILNFRGLEFPHADFRDAQFKKMANFMNAIFKKYTAFLNSSFDDKTLFANSDFGGGGGGKFPAYNIC